MGLAPSRPHTEQDFVLTDDILLEGCLHLDIRTLVNIASVNHRLRLVIKKIIQARIHGPMSNIIPNAHITSFMSMLTNTGSVVPTTNLNVFTPLGGLADWEYYLNNIGFIFSAETRGPDAHSKRTTTFYFHNRGKGSKNAVVVCEARGSSCLTPVLASQYTCHMNFFTADHIYCIHPHLTPQLKTLHVNRRIYNNRERSELNQLLARRVIITTADEEKNLCDDNIVCRSAVRVTGSNPLRLTAQWDGDKVGLFSWLKEKEEFLHSKRIQFWLGGNCDNENCLNNSYVDDDDN